MNAKTVIILLIAAFLGGMVAYTISVIRQAEPAPAVKAQCIDAEMQDHIRKLTLQALELAFQDRVQLLFDTWTRDPESAKAHPHRGQVGMDNAVHAYIYARDLANKWSAPSCAPKPVGVPQ